MPPRPTDRRPTLTLKGEEITPEFRSLMNKAAKKAGTTQVAFAVGAIAAAARQILTGKIQDQAKASPPAVIEGLREEIDRHAAKTRQEMAELREQMMATNRLVAEMGAPGEAKPRGVLSRLFGKRD